MEGLLTGWGRLGRGRPPLKEPDTTTTPEEDVALSLHSVEVKESTMENTRTGRDEVRLNEPSLFTSRRLVDGVLTLSTQKTGTTLSTSKVPLEGNSST